MVLDEDDNVVLSGESDEIKVIFQQLHRWLRDQNVHTVLDGSLRDGIVGI